MEMNKNSEKADALANLYRATLSLARKDKETGLVFLNKAKEILGDNVVKLIQGVTTTQEQEYWAEKVLDYYNKLRLT